MKPLLLIFLLACTASARPFHSKPAPKPVAPVVEAAKPVPEISAEVPKQQPAPEEDISKENIALTLVHISALAKEQKTELDAAQKTIDGLNGNLTDTKGSLKEANVRADAFQIQVNAVAKRANDEASRADKAETDRDYYHQKHDEAVSKLWWWRRWGWLTGILGILILVGAIVVRFTAWGAKTAAPIIASIAKV